MVQVGSRLTVTLASHIYHVPVKLTPSPLKDIDLSALVLILFDFKMSRQITGFASIDKYNGYSP